MTNEAFFLDILGEIDDCYVEEAAPVKKRARNVWIAVAAAAACVALAIAIPVTVRSLQTPAVEPHIEDNPPAPTSGRIDVAVPTAATDETETPVPSIEFIPQYGAFGDGAKTVALSDAQAARLKEQEDLASLADYPTLVDLYPSDQGGLLVEVTPEMLERERKVGQAFLAYYYGAEPTDFDFEFRESVADHIMFYENEEMEVASNLRKISFLLSERYEGEMTAEAIAKQPIVKAALEWSGIQTPEIHEEVEINIAGDPWHYLFSFAEHSDDPVEQLLNFTLRSVTVSVYPPEGLFSFSIRYGEPVLEDAKTPAVTPEQLEAFLSNAYSDNPPTDYVTEVFYSYHVELGKIIPCYRIYLPEPELPRVAGRIVYSVIEVTTAEIVELS